jgi:hypothetical protein
MSVRSGHKTSRSLMETYNGFSIIKVVEIDYERSIFDPSRFSDYPKRKEIHYNFCKEGSENRPSQHYGAWARDVIECRECIDNFIKDDSLYFTAEEREKYIYKPNRKCHWGFSYDSLMKLMRQHQKADKRMKRLIEDRLEDANFHAYCGYLAEGKYKEYEELAAKEITFDEKFEVTTITMRKGIKNPKQLEEGIGKAIADYLASQGIKDTSVNVKFCENW